MHNAQYHISRTAHYMGPYITRRTAQYHISRAAHSMGPYISMHNAQYHKVTQIELTSATCVVHGPRSTI